MKKLLAKIDASLTSWNIHFPKWSKFVNSAVAYCTDLIVSKAPWYSKPVKVVADLFDLVTYEGWAFFGSLICFLVVFG